MTRQFQRQNKLYSPFKFLFLVLLVAFTQLHAPSTLASNGEANQAAKRSNSPDSHHSFPRPFHATYKVFAKGVPFKATAHHKLTQNKDGQMKLEMKISSFFSKLEERAKFQALGNCQFQSDEYKHKRKGLGKNKDYVIQFDWKAATASYTKRRKDPQEFPIEAGLMDRLTQQLAVQCLAAQGREEFTIKIADKNRIKEHKFKVVGKETIETSNAAFETIKVSKVRDNSSRKTTFWLATEHDYALVKMVQEKDSGDRFELVLKTMDGENLNLNGQSKTNQEMDDNQWDGTEEP